MASTSCLYSKKELLKMSFNKTDLVSCKILKCCIAILLNFHIFVSYISKNASRIAKRDTLIRTLNYPKDFLMILQGTGISANKSFLKSAEWISGGYSSKASEKNYLIEFYGLTSSFFPVLCRLFPFKPSFPLVTGNLPPGKLPPGNLPPGNMPPGNLPPGKLPPGNLPPRKFAPRKNAPRKFAP